MKKDASSPDINIRKLDGKEQARLCAHQMASQEPWVTLQRGYEDSLSIFVDPAKEIYVAVAQGEIVGFVVLVMQGAFVGYIQSVGVWPEWRGRAVGTQLIHFAEDRIFARTPNSFICVSSFNGRAQRLYERLGYEAVGELKDWIIPGNSEILYRKTICPLSQFRTPDKSARTCPSRSTGPTPSCIEGE